MIGPEDFGLDPLATLSRVGDATRSPRHLPIWKAMGEAIAAASPRLAPASDPDPSDPSADHQFESLRSVRIGCRLLHPQPRTHPRAAIVTFHGYQDVPAASDEDQRWATLRSRGCAVLIVRVRGFPGSRQDAPDWGYRGDGWITRGLDVPATDGGIATEWSFAHAVADAMLACRAIRATIDAPVFLHGQSFGAALAIVAAANLRDEDAVSRLAIGLPTLGDWPWRLTHRRPGGRGAGAEIARTLLECADREDAIVATLRAFDTVIHARAVRCPVLCKLALLDDVVPAPSAAAVFNALGSDPGLKRRFVTRYGHFDGGIADLRRHAVFERAADRFMDPGVDPLDALAGDPDSA